MNTNTSNYVDVQNHIYICRFLYIFKLLSVVVGFCYDQSPQYRQKFLKNSGTKQAVCTRSPCIKSATEAGLDLKMSEVSAALRIACFLEVGSVGCL